MENTTNLPIYDTVLNLLKHDKITVMDVYKIIPYSTDLVEQILHDYSDYVTESKQLSDDMWDVLMSEYDNQKSINQEINEHK